MCVKSLALALACGKHSRNAGWYHAVYKTNMDPHHKSETLQGNTFNCFSNWNSCFSRGNQGKTAIATVLNFSWIV